MRLKLNKVVRIKRGYDLRAHVTIDGKRRSLSNQAVPGTNLFINKISKDSRYSPHIQLVENIGIGNGPAFIIPEGFTMEFISPSVA